jgi:O-antigen ligase
MWAEPVRGRPIMPGPLFAGCAGYAGAALHFAGALKSTPAGAALPFDLTLAALLLLLAMLPPLVAARRWRLGAMLGPPLAACGALWLWWVLAAAWSPWAAGAADRLPEIVLAGPVMLAAGLLLGAEERALRRFADAVVLLGLLVGLSLAWGLAHETLVLGGEPGADPTRVRVAYQVAGLALATATALAALRAVAAGRWSARLGWLALALALGIAVLLPGGRAAFFAATLAAIFAPALYLALSGRCGQAMLWLAAIAAILAAGLLLLLADPTRAEQLATLERLLRDEGDAPGAREILWGEAWRLSGLWGLGPGGFPPAAGLGQTRGLHPHNHGLEALVEGGLAGLVLWAAAFGGGVLLFLARMGRVAPIRAATILALTLPMALTAMVSTDLGNRMVWLALGLALSLGMEAADV